MAVQPNHNDIYQALGQIEGRMEGLERVISEGFSDIKTLLKDHDERIRSVEETQAKQKGAWRAISVIGGIAATVGGVITSLWTSFWNG